MGGSKPGGNAGYPYPSTEQFDPRGLLPPDPGFVIGVIDTGISEHYNKPHEYLAHNLAPRYGVEQPSGPKRAPRGHGTFIAGLVLREAPFATIAMSNALGDDLDDPKVYEPRIAAAINEFAELANLRVLVLTSYSDEPDKLDEEPLKKAFLNLVRTCPNLVVVTAVSNDWSGEASYPAAYKDELDAAHRSRVVTVGAVDETLSRYDGEEWTAPPKASFANWGGVDVWAAGVRVLGPHLLTWPSYTDGSGTPYGDYSTVTKATGWARWSGSSFAGATVAGLLARALHEDATLGAADALARITGQPNGSTVLPGRRLYVQGTGSVWPPPTGPGPYGA